MDRYAIELPWAVSSDDRDKAIKHILNFDLSGTENKSGGTLPPQLLMVNKISGRYNGLEL